MHYNVAQLLVSAATMAAIVYGEEAIISVGTKKLQHVISDRFLSFTVDPVILLEAARTGSESLQMLAMARSLAPAFLRVAGPDSNYYNFQNTVDPDRSALSADYTVTELQWMVLNEFAQQAGLHLVAALGIADRENGMWSSRNSLELVSLSDKLGYNISWQLGYELQELQQQQEEEISGSQLGWDVVQLRKMLDVFPRYRRSLVLAPDITRFTARDDILFLKEFFSEAGSVLSAVTWHPHTRNGLENSEEAELLMDVLDRDGNALRKSIGRTLSKKPLWIAESEGNSSQGRFKDALVWCQRLGAAAQLGAEVLMKKLSVPIMSQPSPEYWVSVLYKYLVGRAVLDARMVHGNRTHLRVFAHCAADRGSGAPHYEKGAVVVFGVNLKDSDATLALKAASWGHGLEEDEVHHYVLTSSADNLESGEVLLNGQLLKLNPDGSLPIFMPTIHHTEQSIVVSIPPNSIGFWVVPNAKVRPCMTPASGRGTDFEGLAVDNHMKMNWEHPEVNTDFINSDVGGLRRLRRKHSTRHKLSSLNSRKRGHKGKMTSSEETHKDKTRMKISRRPKRYMPLDSGPYVIPGLSVELFNPSQHSVKSRIGVNYRKKNILNQSSTKLTPSRRRTKSFETDDDIINANVQASLADSDDYYSTEDGKQFSKHHKRAYGTEFAQRDTFLATSPRSHKGDCNKDYIYVDDNDNHFDYELEDNFDVDSGLEEQDEIRHFHEPGEFFENVKLLPSAKTKHENFGELWEVEGFANGDEHKLDGRESQKETYERASTPNMQTYFPHNFYIKTMESPPARYTKNSMKHVNYGQRQNENTKYHKQTSPTYIAQNDDHEFLLYNTGENTRNGYWMQSGENGRIRSVFEDDGVEQRKIKLDSIAQTGHGLSKKTDANVGDQTNEYNSGLAKPKVAIKTHTQVDESQAFRSTDDLSDCTGNKQTTTFKENCNFNKEKGDELSNRSVASSSEDSGTYTLKQQSEINKMIAGPSVDNFVHESKKHKGFHIEYDSSNITSRRYNTTDVDGKNNNTTDKVDAQYNNKIETDEPPLQIMEPKSRSPRDLSVHYKPMSSNHFLNSIGGQHSYFGTAKPLVLRSEELSKYLADYNDYDASRETPLEELIFTRIRPNRNTAPEFLDRSRVNENARRPRVELKLRPSFEIEPLYYDYYRVNNDIDSKSKYKREEAKQFQEGNLEQPNIHSDGRFLTLDVTDYNDKLLQLRDIYSPTAANDDATLIQIPGDITYSSAEEINDASLHGHRQLYKPYEKRQSELAERTNLLKNLYHADAPEEKQRNETQGTEDQTERIVRSPQAHVAQTETVPDYDLTTVVTENSTTQVETTTNIQETEHGSSNHIKLTEEELQTNQLDTTTEFHETIHRNVNKSEVNYSKNSMYGYKKDEDTTLTITNYILNSVTKTPSHELQKPHNFNTAEKHSPNNLDPAYSQSSGNFKLSRKRENMNDNTYNIIKLPIPKENIDSKGNSNEEVTDMHTFTTTLPDYGLNEEIFLADANDKKGTTMTSTEENDEINKKSLSGSMTSNAAETTDEDAHRNTEKNTDSHEKYSRSAVVPTEKDSNAQHAIISPEHLGPSEDKIVTENSSNDLKETPPHLIQEMPIKRDTSNEDTQNDGVTNHLAQNTQVIENMKTADTITYGTEECKNTIIDSRSVSNVTDDTHNYDKDMEKETNNSWHDASEENRNTVSTGITHTTNPPNDANAKSHTMKSKMQKSLHSEVAGFKDTSETHESNTVNGNSDKEEERKGNIKSSRVIRMQGETPATRFILPTVSPLRALPDITKRRELIIKNLNERHARLRARLLARTGNGDNERGNPSNRRKLREALDQPLGVNEPSNNQNHFSPNLVIVDPSISTEAFIEQYLLQQQKQMPLLTKEITKGGTLFSKNHNFIQTVDREYNDKIVPQAESSVKSSHHNTNQLDPRYYYRIPMKAYTSFIMNNIGGTRTAGPSIEMPKIISPPSTYKHERENDFHVYTNSYQETNQNDERKQRLARETLPLHSNMHYYMYPQTEELYTFSDMESSSEYPYSGIYDYNKLEKAVTPRMTLDYNVHPDDFMIDDLDEDSVRRHGRNVYITEDHQWSDSDKYDEKLGTNEELPIMFEIHDPDMYEEDSIFSPEHNDDIIFDTTSCPDYTGYQNVISNGDRTDRTWDEFLRMLDETELEAENEMELMKSKSRGGSLDDGTETNNIHPPLLDTKNKKHAIPDKIHVTHRLKRSINIDETHNIDLEDTDQKTMSTNKEQTENFAMRDHLHSQHYKAKTTRPTLYKMKYNNIPGILINPGKLLKEDNDKNTIYIPKTKASGDDERSKYSREKNKQYSHNIKNNMHQAPSVTANHRNNYIESNSIGSIADREESKEMLNKETTEEVMHVVFYAYPTDASTDTVVKRENYENDKIAMTEPNLVPLQLPGQHHDQSPTSHLTDDDTFNLFSNENGEVSNFVTKKYTRSQSKSNEISIASILFQALGTIIQFFKDFNIV